MANEKLTEQCARQGMEAFRDRLTIALKAAKICVFEVDIVNQLYTYFENAEDIFGVSGEKILEDVRPYSLLTPQEYQRAVSDYFSHPDDHAVINRAFQSIFSGEPTTYEARMRAAGSNYIWCKLDVTPIVENGITVKMIGVITDISQMKARRDLLVEETRLDGFTGLYNKKYSLELIRKALQEHPEQKHALALMDIDHFKFFNDTYGHAVGDRVIKAVADAWKDYFRVRDIGGRFGGDEFILFAQNVLDLGWLNKSLQRMIACECDGYRCTNSIGVAIYPQDAQDFDELFQKADYALYHAKLKRASYVFYGDIKEETCPPADGSAR